MLFYGESGLPAARVCAEEGAETCPKATFLPQMAPPSQSPLSFGGPRGGHRTWRRTISTGVAAPVTGLPVPPTHVPRARCTSLLAASIHHYHHSLCFAHSLRSARGRLPHPPRSARPIPGLLRHKNTPKRLQTSGKALFLLCNSRREPFSSAAPCSFARKGHPRGLPCSAGRLWGIVRCAYGWTTVLAMPMATAATRRVSA